MVMATFIKCTLVTDPMFSLSHVWDGRSGMSFSGSERTVVNITTVHSRPLVTTH